MTSKGSWCVKEPLPFGIADAPAVSYRDRLFVIGGYGKTPNDIKNKVLEYDATEDKWRLKSPFSERRWGATAALQGGHIYIFGGRRAGKVSLRPFSKLVEQYDIKDDSWTALDSVPRRLRSQGLMAVTVGAKIFLFNEAFTFEYDPASGRYSRRANAPLARRWSTCAYVKAGSEDRIYIIGGFDSSTSNATDANYYYLPASDIWCGPRTSAPYRAYGVTRDNPVWKNKIYFGFGHTDPDKFYGDLYAYDPENDNWSNALGKAHFERDGVACAVIDDSIYVIGGRSEPNDSVAFGLTHNERFDLRSFHDSINQEN